MSVRYLLDSNVISEPIRPRANPGVVRALLEHAGKVGMATVVWHELLFGWERLPPSLKKRTIGDYLFQVVSANMPILPYDQAAAEWHARERARLTAIGKIHPSSTDRLPRSRRSTV